MLRAALEALVLRLQKNTQSRPLLRSYSLSGPISTESYRISVKIEPNGAAGTWLRNSVKVGDCLDVSSPRGSFTLQSSDQPIVLLSAGIGATPVLAMLHALTAAQSAQDVLWLHSARDGRHHPFVAEVRRLIHALPRGRSYICYSSPSARDQLGEDLNTAGHLSRSLFKEAGVRREAEVYLCGPNRFMADMKIELTAFGVAQDRIRLEIFNGGEPMTPGVVNAAVRMPHMPADNSGTGPLVSFARSGVAAHWQALAYQSILELAEACDVAVRWSCRSGVCHSCETGLVSGAVLYGPEPLDPPAEGNVLVRCSQPVGDVVIDL
jgi:ferredoxin-NADP reductase